jgi:hypothetical protein
MNMKSCPNATAEACQEAQAILMGKGMLTSSEPIFSIPNPSSADPTSSEDTTLTVVKKRKAGGKGQQEHYFLTRCYKISKF